MFLPPNADKDLAVRPLLLCTLHSQPLLPFQGPTSLSWSWSLPNHPMPLGPSNTTAHSQNGIKPAATACVPIRFQVTAPLSDWQISGSLLACLPSVLFLKKTPQLTVILKEQKRSTRAPGTNHRELSIDHWQPRTDLWEPSINSSHSVWEAGHLPWATGHNGKGGKGVGRWGQSLKHKAVIHIYNMYFRILKQQQKNWPCYRKCRLRIIYKNSILNTLLIHLLERPKSINGK